MEVKGQLDNSVFATQDLNEGVTHIHKPPTMVKLFVGQIPKTMFEEQLKNFFEQFGSVVEVSVIRDRSTGAHRGCAFVTYSARAEAEHCIQSLHNIKALPPMANPLQVKYADGELERLEHKLFVGMVPKNVTEEQLRKVFDPYGTIVELSILRGPDGFSKGCAFLKYEHRQEAISAINACHGQVFMPGGAQSLVVKFADVPKKKEGGNKQQQDSLLALKNQQLQLLIQQMASSIYQFPSYPTSLSTSTSGLGPSQLYGASGLTTSLTPPASPPSQLGQYTSQLASQLAAVAAYSPYTTSISAPPIPTQQLGRSGGGSSQLEGTLTLSVVFPSMFSDAEDLIPKGPPGANLFVYHLPQHFNDTDLASSFSSYGNVVSAKVFIDKATGQSKCFGFVSYDSATSAQIAIQQMNGFQIGQKRLKVELKRSRGQPY